MTGKEVVFSKGKLTDAIRASMAIPTLLTAVTKDDMVLVDGGVINPLPINMVVNDNTDLTIAVDMDADIPDSYVVDVPKEYQTSEQILYDKFMRFIKKHKHISQKNC